MLFTIIAVSVSYAAGVATGIGLREYEVLTMNDLKKSADWLIEKGRQTRQKMSEPKTEIK